MQISGCRPLLPRQRGFTLGEVLIALGVLGVSLSIVVPTLSSVTRENLRAGAVNELVGTLHLARSEAITRNTPVVICPSADGSTCGPVPWESGWIRFVDDNGDYRADSGEEVLGVSPPLAGLRIRTRTFAQAFGFGPNGGPAAADGSGTGGDFSFCADNGDAQVVLITATGRPLLADHLANGQPPDCPPA